VKAAFILIGGLTTGFPVQGPLGKTGHGSGVTGQCSRKSCLARWTVWIPHRGPRGRAGRENSKKEQATGPIEVFEPDSS
jgi:hypothetical protein